MLASYKGCIYRRADLYGQVDLDRQADILDRLLGLYKLALYRGDFEKQLAFIYS